MVRKHGWQLPAHTFQVVAITVFCLLVVAFYAFFAPFLWGRIWEYALIAAYSPVALLVFILYVRSTAINPADPGIMSKFDSKGLNKPNAMQGILTKDQPRKFDEIGSRLPSSPSSMSKSSIGVANSSKKGSAGEVGIEKIPVEPASQKSFLCNFKILCALFVHEDCCKQEAVAGQQGTGEDALFCTLCNAEVGKFSKHCRSCDKCVDGFDHHCRLVIEVAAGIAVLVRSFVDKKSMETEIIDRLGNGFSRAPFVAVVAVCTAVSLLACLPLGELFFFHMLLIKKGITTYEYVVAMRAVSEVPAGASIDEELLNGLYSPTGSATTGFSGGSSLGLQHKGAWCTPPRVFVDYQDEVVPHLEPGMLPSTVDPDADGAEMRNKVPKRPVRMSAWKLAKLDSNEAMKAAAKARASSSVLRPIDNRRMPDIGLSSSGDMSFRSSASMDTVGNKEVKSELRLSPLRNSFAPSQPSLDGYETGTQSASSFSSPSHVHESLTLAPLPQVRGLGHLSAPNSAPTVVADRLATSGTAFPNTNKAISRPSSGFDEAIIQKGSNADPLLLSAPAVPFMKDAKRTSVIWDQEAGRYISVPLSASETQNRSSLQISVSNSNTEISSHRRRVIPWQESSSSLTVQLQQSERLMYTGESIFFAGPRLSLPVTDGQRKEGSSGVREVQETSTPILPQKSRLKREVSSNQLPVFIPGGLHKKPPSGLDL
ncbi:probable protein S-acyltransferase 19 isoform X2 [Malania oleifera]|uniref:probable protein S-acyltransferase 19 isoform X2 n=1 Tax=Malania oleifera TaxID=397392 RepID=UPI0025AE17C3|nr:probable protein S-acyltransferase 19 isoform X2 [Malania oleifera]